MERIRLTERMAHRNRKADSAVPETAIDLGKNRTYHKIDEYHTYEQTVNYELPDMRHEWKEDRRDETGHGIPKMAKVYMAAKKATKLAMMLLGEDANEEALEQQARAFMRMGDKALTASIERWAECNCDENGNCECDADDETEAPAEQPAEAPAEQPAEAPAEQPAEAPAEAPAEQPAPKAEEADETEEPVVEATAEEKADVEVSDELVDTDVDFDDEPADDADTGADAGLEACFNGADEEEEAAPVAEPATACNKKAGLKKLAGQPTLVRVASKNADDLVKLSNCWKWSE